MTLYGCNYLDDRLEVRGREVSIDGLERPALVTHEGMVVYGRDGKKILVTQLQLEDGRMIPAANWGKQLTVVKLELTSEEETLRDKIRVRKWSIAN